MAEAVAQVLGRLFWRPFVPGVAIGVPRFEPIKRRGARVGDKLVVEVDDRRVVESAVPESLGFGGAERVRTGPNERTIECPRAVCPDSLGGHGCPKRL